MHTENKKVSPCFEENIKILEEMFSEDKTVKKHRFSPSDKLLCDMECCIFFIDGMVDSPLINDNIIKPILLHTPVTVIGRDRLSYLESKVLQACETSQTDSFDDLLYALLYGDTVLFCKNCHRALIIGTKNFAKRGISEPPYEPILKGPREGFTETLLMNISLLRRKVRNKNFKVENFELGNITKTSCSICYIDGCVKPDIIQELRDRLNKIDIDGIFDSNYVAELIQDKKWSPIKNTGSTERPDIAAAKLLEGRIVLFVDGSPVALTVPHIFIEGFQSQEDYYVNYYFAAINRLLRIIGFFLSISITPIFISLMRFHRELIPSQLLLSIAAARQGVPLSIVMEALILLLAFEILREAGIRTPSAMGQTLSIVGGLVVGQAAVDAHIVSPAMLIIVAFSGITGLIVPKQKSIVIIVRLSLIVMSIFLGLYGYILGMLWFLIFLAEHSSFGVPIMSYLPFVRLGSKEDSIVRSPFQLMKKKHRFIAGWRK